jgi:hypothetical protein
MRSRELWRALRDEMRTRREGVGDWGVTVLCAEDLLFLRGRVLVLLEMRSAACKAGM